MPVETKIRPITEIDPALVGAMKTVGDEVLRSFAPVPRPDGLPNQKLDIKHSNGNGSYAEQHPVPVPAAPVTERHPVPVLTEPDINALFHPIDPPEAFTMKQGRWPSFFGPTALPVNANGELPSWLTTTRQPEGLSSTGDSHNASTSESTGPSWLPKVRGVFSHITIGRSKRQGRHAAGRQSSS